MDAVLTLGEVMESKQDEIKQAIDRIYYEQYDAMLQMALKLPAQEGLTYLSSEVKKLNSQMNADVKAAAGVSTSNCR